MKNTTAQVIVRPDALERVASIAAEFERAGFTTGPLVANNFSIEGDEALFERYFAAPSAANRDTSKDQEWPLKSLSPDLQDAVETIVSTKLPDFGPGNF